jgi:hypothetical protein
VGESDTSIGTGREIAEQIAHMLQSGPHGKGRATALYNLAPRSWSRTYIQRVSGSPGPTTPGTAATRCRAMPIQKLSGIRSGSLARSFAADSGCWAPGLSAANNARTE